MVTASMAIQATETAAAITEETPAPATKMAATAMADTADHMVTASMAIQATETVAAIMEETPAPATKMVAVVATALTPTLTAPRA